MTLRSDKHQICHPLFEHEIEAKRRESLSERKISPIAIHNSLTVDEDLRLGVAADQMARHPADVQSLEFRLADVKRPIDLAVILCVGFIESALLFWSCYPW